MGHTFSKFLRVGEASRDPYESLDGLAAGITGAPGFKFFGGKKKDDTLR